MRLNLQLKISHKGFILVLVPLVFELVFLIVLSVLLQQAEVEVQRQVRSKAIISQANALSKLFYDAGVAMGGYSITKSPLFSDRYDKIVRQIPLDLQELKGLVGDNDKQQLILGRLQTITSDGLKILGEAKAAIDDNRVDVAQFRARHMYKQIRQLADQLQDELKGLTEDERKIESESPEQQNRSRAAVKMFLVFGVVLNIGIAFLLLYYFLRSISTRLSTVTDNSFRLARGQKLRPPLSGNDEIAQLDDAFRSMAEALAEASRKERAVIENAADVICSIDMDGKFVAVNPASYESWGFYPDELMGRRFIEVIMPEDVPDTIRAVRSVRGATSKVNFENRVKKRDGSMVNVLWSADWSEKDRALFCVAHDITQRKLVEEAIKANEARIRNIINNMMVGLIIITRDGLIESINPRTESMFSTRSHEMLGRHVMSLFADARHFSVSDPNDRQSFMETLFTKALNRIGEFDCLSANGEDFPVEISLTEFVSPDGAVRFMANVLDVSERKEVERMKKEFVSTVSHELRTPLTSIRGSLTLLAVGAMGALPEQAKKVVNIAERNTIRLIGLINDILDVEKLEAGKLDMELVDVAVASIFERSEQAVNTFAANNGVLLDMKPSGEMVHADGDRLVQVLVNLISNAVKFSPKGAAVTVSSAEIPGGFIEVHVTDRGRGIPESFKNRLFQRFQQVEASDAKKKGGTGLGLAICKGIVEQHGGTIGVESEEGKGSTFWFRIPKAQNLLKQPVQVLEPAASMQSNQAF
ncbi:MAG: domain S-box protein [Cyanobacteriota bacterium erpe_2018_sw_21hr_WHONDRS-SW48-000092_B_bin.40]|jgi:PAS domain S-box-containing protein|nr:domain S-box protein [Cyanobacteriota bacterium erpe_2018_sw_21hr_WHONDRS-SW48-000092_B_bin.40]